MVDAHVSGTCPSRDGGSSPLLGTPLPYNLDLSRLCSAGNLAK